MSATGLAFTNFHVNIFGNAMTDPITQCDMDHATYIVPWPAESPTRFSGPDYFLGFEQDHVFFLLGPQAAGAYLDFLLAHVGPLD